MTTTRQGKRVRECKHCKGDIAIRNPKEFCDHLYYPEYCDECLREQNAKGEYDQH